MQKTQALFDEDGYPSDQTLEDIVNFSLKEYINNPSGFFELSEKVFNKFYGSWETVDSYQNPELSGEEPFRVLRIATGGWSGNEMIIRAMKKNFIWSIHFLACFRGGLYIIDAKGIA